jgi:hypothetical protein
MNHHSRREITNLKSNNFLLSISVAFLLVLLVFMVYIANDNYTTGLQRGAKIGMSDSNYRIEEVRAGCDTLFEPSECVKCHPFH